MIRTSIPTFARGLAATALLAGVLARASPGVDVGRAAPSPVLYTINLGPGPAGVAADIAIDPARHRAYATSSDDAAGRVSMLDTRTGRLLRAIPVASPAGSVAVDAPTGRLFVLHAPPIGVGSVGVIDAEDGVLLRTVRLAQSPRAVLADPQRGHVFVLTQGVAPSRGGVAMLDGRTGTLLRTIPTDPGPPSAMALDERDGRVVVVGVNRVRILDAATGDVRHVVALRAGIGAGVAADGRVGRAFVTGADRVGVLDVATGAVVREVPLDGGMGVAADEATGRVFVGGVRGTVHVLDALTGTVLRRVAVRGVVAAIDELGGNVFVVAPGPLVGGRVAGSGVVSVLDARDGSPRGVFAAGHLPVALAIDERAGRGLMVDQQDDAAIIFATRMPAGGGPPTLPPPATPAPSSSLLPRTMPIAGSAVAVDERAGRAIVLTPAGVDLLDARTGSVLRTVGLPRPPLAMAIDADAGRAFVALYFTARSAPPPSPPTIVPDARPDTAGDGAIVVLDALDGRVLRTVSVGGQPLALATDGTTGRVFVGVTTGPGGGRVVTIDAETGSIVRSVSVVGNPGLIAVDERTGRTFVASPMSDTVSVLDATSGAVLGATPLRFAIAESTQMVVDAAAGLVLVSSGVGASGYAYEVSLLDARSGAVQARIDTGAPAAPLAVDARGCRAYATTTVGGYLSAGGSAAIAVIDERAATVARRVAIGRTPIVALVVAGGLGRVFALSASLTDPETLRPAGPGVLRALDIRTDALVGAALAVGEVSGGSGPSLAVDERTKRVFVLTNNSVVVLDATRL